MRYQFRFDGRPGGPIRDKWHDAAQDAVNAGCGVWKRDGSVSLSVSGVDAEIYRVPDKKPETQPSK